MSSGASSVPEALSDTGPVLHLHEIEALRGLIPFSPLQFPELVWEELRARGIVAALLRAAGIDPSVSAVEEGVWQAVLRLAEPVRIQPADAQVFALAQAGGFQALVLTDDLALRRLLESHGCTVVGSVGVLIRAHVSGVLRREELERSIDDLFEVSSLHWSSAFRAYVRQLLEEMLPPG